MSVRRLLVFTCDLDGRTAEVEVVPGEVPAPPSGWTKLDDKVCCDRHATHHEVGRELGGRERLVLHPQFFLARMTGPEPIPVRSMTYDPNTPGGPSWTIVVAADHVEAEPR